MNTTTQLGFNHLHVPGTSERTLLLLHGTGGTEQDLLPLGRSLDPAAHLLSPRGKVLENGMPRFFRRLAEGVFDEEDLIRRAEELAVFVTNAVEAYDLNPARITAVGYSNGANIASAMMLLHPDILANAALLRGMVPLVPDHLPRLEGRNVLIASGHLDPIVPASNARQLAGLFREAGAEVTLRFENTGHNLTSQTIESTQHWLHSLA